MPWEARVQSNCLAKMRFGFCQACLVPAKVAKPEAQRSRVAADPESMRVVCFGFLDAPAFQQQVGTVEQRVRVVRMCLQNLGISREGLIRTVEFGNSQAKVAQRIDVIRVK